VNPAHRFLKNKITSLKGWRAYALFSEDCIKNTGIEPRQMFKQMEKYEHLGEIYTYSYNLDERYRAFLDETKYSITPVKAAIVLSKKFNVHPQKLWQWMNDPKKRNQWIKTGYFQVKKRPKGYTNPGSINHCTTRNFVELFRSWHPYKEFTVKQKRGPVDMTITYYLDWSASYTNKSDLVCETQRYFPVEVCERLSARSV
jgi:hypothetical protein